MTYFRGISTTSQHLRCYNVRNECKTISTLRCMTKPIDFLEQGEKCFHKTLTNICIKYNVFKSITCSTLCFEYHSININKKTTFTRYHIAAVCSVHDI